MLYALATIVQGDSPLDDRTFWRTRPIAPGTMATAKLVTGALFVASQLLVVLIVALLVRIPLSHWPSSVAQVVVTDAAGVGLVLFLSSRTRRVATLLVALPVSIIGAYLLLVVISETLRGPWIRHVYAIDQPDSLLAVPTMLLVFVAGVWTMTAMAFLGERYRLRLWLVGAVGTLALVVVWFVPGARMHRATEPRFARSPSLAVDAASVRAERATASGRVTLFAEAHLAGLHTGDRARQYLAQGTLEADGTSLTARSFGDPKFLRGQPGPSPVLLGVLSAEDFARLAGRPARFDGRIDIEVARTDVIGVLPVATGAELDAGDLRLHIRALRPPLAGDAAAVVAGVWPGQISLATADVTWTARWAQRSRLSVSRWWLRQGARTEAVGRFMRTPLASSLQLPSLAKPFGRERSVLTVPSRAGEADLDLTTASLVLDQTSGPVFTQKPVTLDFVVPRTAPPTSSHLGIALR